MQTLIDALSKDGVDEEKLLDEATKEFRARETKQLEHLSQVLAILTPEQRMELKKLL
jgi:Spy/CpxP family protein refolding chaperone